MTKRLSILVIFIIIFASILSLTGYAKNKTTLKIINAGSLLVPFKEIEKAFEEIYPDIDVLIEGHGSIQVIRHVTEIAQISGEPIADIVAVADYSLIPKMMYNTLIPETEKNYASWCIKFASNSLGLAYTSQSKYNDEINENNWYKIISRPEVRIGISDPRFDACGYRALMVTKLAEILYKQEGILGDIIGKFSYPIKVSENNQRYTILVPEILEPESLVIRDSSIKLLFTLESGDIDYAYEYKSVAEQHNMIFLEFPPEINLLSNQYESLCSGMKVKLAFQRFASVNPEFEIQPIIYGMTIPCNAPHPELAEKWVKFVLGPKGQEIFRRERQISIVPALVDNKENLPPELWPYAEEE